MTFTASTAASVSGGIGAPAPPKPPAPPALSGAAAIGARSQPSPKKATPPDPASSLMFHLNVDGLNAGWWNSFEGLGMETAIEQREEGGLNIWVHQLPTRLKFTNIKLTRPINEDSAEVAVWFTKFLTANVRTGSAVISAVDGNKKIIAQWNLRGVVPVRWTGPSFNVESPKMATETLELAHHGFESPIAKEKR